MTFKILTAALALAASALAVNAEPADSSQCETLRPVFAAYTLSAGSSHLADTYLSPIKYSGWKLGLGYERHQAMAFNPDRWVQRLKFDVEVDRTVSLTGGRVMWYFGMDLSWAMIHRWRIDRGLSVGVGGDAVLNAGCLYIDRGGNNPASAKLSLTVGATGYVAWNGKIGRLPVTLRYQPSIPVIGAFFAPDYGELYYEIYLGNRKGLCHCAWWGDFFRLDHQLTADLSFGSTNLRVGYAGQIFSSKVNDITTRIFTHAAVIGISGEWLSFNPRRGLSKEARTVSATY